MFPGSRCRPIAISLSPHSTIGDLIVISPSDSNFLIDYNYAPLKWVFDLSAFLCPPGRFTRFALFGEVRPRSQKPGMRAYDFDSIALVIFTSTTSSTSIGFITVSPIVSEVCAATDAPYNATGLAVRAIRINPQTQGVM